MLMATEVLEMEQVIEVLMEVHVEERAGMEINIEKSKTIIFQ